MRQEGILSTYFFKIHGNPILDRIDDTGRGCYIGEICCAGPTCADDMLLLADDLEVLQILLSIAVDNSILEKYIRQPVKSVLLCMLNLAMQRTTTEVKPQVTMKGEPMPVVNETMHMGILRSNDTQATAVSQNITKTKRTLYSLMQGCGNTMLDLSDLVPFHLGQVENFYLLVRGQVQMY